MVSLIFRRVMQLKDGDILGHETMGIIDEVGPQVTNFKKGGEHPIHIERSE